MYNTAGARRVLAATFMVVVAILGASSPLAGQGSPVLVQSGDLVYQGAFRLPGGTYNGSSFDYGGTALGFNPARNSLFLVGHDWYQLAAEVSVPEIRRGANARELATASLLQSFFDPTDGKLGTLNPGDPNGIKVGGLLPYQGRLYVTGFASYDGSGSQSVSHFSSGLDLSIRGDVQGPYKLGTGAGFVSGYFGLIPAAWQAALGGPVLNGNCCLNVIGRTSFGPAAFAINPADFGVKNPVPATPLVYYPQAHQTLGGWSGSNQYFNGTSQVRGVVFPEGTRSVLFFGRHGLGTFCYGEGAACADPADRDKGSHGYPYAYYVWAYDANDLAAVKSGQKNPWDVRPYAVWPLTLPYAAGAAVLNGAAYDPATGRIFVSAAYGDGSAPVIHVFTIAGVAGAGPSGPSPSGTTPALGAPTALSGTSSGSTVTLTWSAPAAGVPTTYIVEAGSTPGATDHGTLSTQSPGTIWSMPNVAPGRYYARVRAVSAGGTSAPSNEVVILVGGACSSAPPAPRLSSDVSGTAVTLRWSDSPGATSYRVEAGSAPGMSDLVNSSTGTGATTGVYNVASRGTYYVRVRAENACGPGAPSNESLVVVR